MPFIRFKRDYRVEAAGGATYSSGDVVECSEATAEHFIARQAAELCDSKPAAADEPAEDAPKPESKPAVKARSKKGASTDEAES